MAATEVPTSWRMTCDACGAVEVKPAKSRPAHWIDLHLLRDAYDYQGCAVADGSIKLLLCAACADCVTKAINASLEERRTSKDTNA